MPLPRPFVWFALSLALVLLGTPAVAVAQGDDATPAVGVQATPIGRATRDDGYNAAGDPLVGTAVQYLEEDGTEIAIVTVVDLIDPFEDYEEFAAPDPDTRYVAIEVRVESTGDEVDVEPFDFGLQTVDGFFFGDTFVSRDPAAGDDRPELEITEVEEGDEVSGLLFFAVPEEAELARVLWQPESGRLLVLADLREQ